MVLTQRVSSDDHKTASVDLGSESLHVISDSSYAGSGYIHPCGKMEPAVEEARAHCSARTSDIKVTSGNQSQLCALIPEKAA